MRSEYQKYVLTFYFRIRWNQLLFICILCDHQPFNRFVKRTSMHRSFTDQATLMVGDKNLMTRLGRNIRREQSFLAILSTNSFCSTNLASIQQKTAATNDCTEILCNKTEKIEGDYTQNSEITPTLFFLFVLIKKKLIFCWRSLYCI